MANLCISLAKFKQNLRQYCLTSAEETLQCTAADTALSSSNYYDKKKIEVKKHWKIEEKFSSLNYEKHVN